MSAKSPVPVDASFKAEEHLSIECVLKDSDFIYHVKVFGPDKEVLFDRKIENVMDRTSLSAAVAVAFAQDPNFGFGRDQIPYRWNGRQWVDVEQWIASIDYSMHLLIRTTASRSRKGESSSFFAEAFNAWQAKTKHDCAGLNLKAFGFCPGIPFLDGVLKLNWGKMETVPHDPMNMNLHVLNLTIQEAWEAYFELETGMRNDSMLMKFLTSSLDADQIVAFRRWLGYHLISNRVTNAEKFLYMYGTGANGKSQILALIRALVGKNAVAELRLIDLKTPANLEKLVAKLAMVGSEASTATELEMLKQLVSREPFTCNPKYRDPFTIEPECLITQASNYPPAFSDKTDALERRTLAFHLRHSFKDGEKKVEDLAKQILETEYPLLVGLALWGAHEISERGRFEVPDSITHFSSTAVAMGNQIEQFKALLEFGQYEISFRELYAAYRRWSTETGQPRPESQEELLAGIERIADKAKKKITRSNRKGYVLSRWNGQTGDSEFVAPSLKGVVKPQVLRGVRVNYEAQGWLIGQDLPATSLFEA